MGRAVEALRHGHLERDWLNALGALAVVSEFWRIHQALERYQARAASIHVQSVAMLPHDYRWDVRLHGANAQADRELNGRWSALKQKWRSGLGKAEEPARPGLAFPTAFPEEWLGEGTKLLLAPWPNPPRVAGVTSWSSKPMCRWRTMCPMSPSRLPTRRTTHAAPCRRTAILCMEYRG